MCSVNELVEELLDLERRKKQLQNTDLTHSLLGLQLVRNRTNLESESVYTNQSLASWYSYRTLGEMASRITPKSSISVRRDLFVVFSALQIIQ